MHTTGKNLRLSKKKRNINLKKKLGSKKIMCTFVDMLHIKLKADVGRTDEGIE